MSIANGVRVCGVALFFTAAACGGKSVVIGDGGGPGAEGGTPFDGGGPMDSGIGADTGPGTDTGTGPVPDGGLRPSCPEPPPTQGQACSSVGVWCQYDDTNPNPHCDNTWSCEPSGWVNEQYPTCEIPPPGSCPASFTSVTPQETCSDNGQICEYPEGACICTTDPGGLPTAGGPYWSCTVSGSDCPEKVPVLGSPCDSGESCNYGACNGGIAVECSDGYWTIAETVCPA